jgi:hypothetical protein
MNPRRAGMAGVRCAGPKRDPAREPSRPAVVAAEVGRRCRRLALN